MPRAERVTVGITEPNAGPSTSRPALALGDRHVRKWFFDETRHESKRGCSGHCTWAGDTDATQQAPGGRR